MHNVDNLVATYIQYVRSCDCIPSCIYIILYKLQQSYKWKKHTMENAKWFLVGFEKNSVAQSRNESSNIQTF